MRRIHSSLTLHHKVLLGDDAFVKRYQQGRNVAMALAYLSGAYFVSEIGTHLALTI